MIQILGQNQPTSQVAPGYDSYRRLWYADVADVIRNKRGRDDTHPLRPYHPKRVRPISLRGVQMENSLAGRRIVVPETRELDVFARMLEQHGAITIRCPMVAIYEVADAAPVVAWLRRFTSDPPNDLIPMPGGG